tara:strand:- start:304 stop:573 length:270 start_codon:yes stop_codon:yes gene_type:complete
MSRIVKFFLIFLISLVLFFIIMFLHDEKQKRFCYQKCSEFHVMGEAVNWEYNEYLIFEDDTIWIDKECYDSWCICMDECKPGLCCKLLK